MGTLKSSNRVKWFGIQPTDPASAPIPVILEDEDQNTIGIEGNPLVVEDTGTNTNPEKYIHDHAFRSAPTDRAGGVATALYTTATTPARTAGRSIDIWWIYFYNHSGAEATAWLEAPAGTQVSQTVRLENGQSVLLQVKPLPVGNNNILVNASANNVQAQIGGIEV